MENDYFLSQVRPFANDFMIMSDMVMNENYWWIAFRVNEKKNIIYGKP